MDLDGVKSYIKHRTSYILPPQYFFLKTSKIRLFQGCFAILYNFITVGGIGFSRFS